MCGLWRCWRAGERLSKPLAANRRLSWVPICALAAVPGLALAQPIGEQQPVPAIGGILSAFARAPIVAILDVHRDSAFSEFRIALIRDPAFVAPGRVIVIEWGNAFYQNLLDRFVSGESPAPTTSGVVWRTAIGATGGIWDSPVYERFLVAVRDMNRRLPRERRVRVLTCGPPVDWDRVHTRADYLAIESRIQHRDSYCAGVLEREVLSRGLSALLIMGGGHLLRGGAVADLPEPNVTRQLDARHPGALFVVTNRGSINSNELTRGWREPTFLPLKGTALGHRYPGCPRCRPIRKGRSRRSHFAVGPHPRSNRDARGRGVLS